MVEECKGHEQVIRGAQVVEDHGEEAWWVIKVGVRRVWGCLRGLVVLGRGGDGEVMVGVNDVAARG